MNIDKSLTSILNKILSSKGQSIQNTSQNIFESGLFDSFSIIEIIISIEKEFKISIETEDLTSQNFSSIKTMSKLIKKMQSEI